MRDNQIQEIIDYLEKGEDFTQLLIDELKRKDIEEYERRTYTGLLEALLGATELYCSMKLDDEDDEDGSIRMEQTTAEDARKIINGMLLCSFRTTYDGYNPNEQSGNGFTFSTGLDEEVSKYRDLFIRNDGTVFISKEY